MEEKRGLIGRNTSLSMVMVGESSIGMAISRTARTLTESVALLKYWPDGLTGSVTAAISSSIDLSCIKAINLVLGLEMTLSF